MTENTNALTNSPLMGDFAPGDVSLAGPDLLSLADDPNYCAIALKVSEGTSYATTQGGWLNRLWPQAKDAWRGCQYAKTRFRLGYHYLIVAGAGQDGRAYGRRQYDWFQATIEAVGGWGDGDMWATWDLESGDQPPTFSNQQIIDTANGFSERAKEITGRMVMRYSGSLVRDRGIVDKMGAEILWCAEYGAPGQPAKLDPSVYLKQGYTLTDTLWWQYKGNTDAGLAPPGYPNLAPCGPAGAMAKADISAGIINGGSSRQATINWIARNLTAKTITLGARPITEVPAP